MKNKILLIGKNSDIGNNIFNTLKLDYDIFAYGKSELDLSKNNLLLDNTINPNIIIYCAGINNIKTIDDVSINDFIEHININCLGLFEIVKNYKNSLINGKIVVISSLYGHLTRKNRLMYSTSKHALNGLIKSLSLELAENNTLVNSISPGFVDTKLTRKNNTNEKIKELCQKVPLKRLILPEEITKVVRFLISNDNTFITGQDIVIDGGYSIGGFEI